MKVKVSEYRERYFSEGSAPDPRTVVARIKRGDLVGEKEGNLWYVYPDLKPTKEQKIKRAIAEFDQDCVA